MTHYVAQALFSKHYILWLASKKRIPRRNIFVASGDLSSVAPETYSFTLSETPVKPLKADLRSQRAAAFHHFSAVLAASPIRRPNKGLNFRVTHFLSYDANGR